MTKAHRQLSIEMETPLVVLDETIMRENCARWAHAAAAAGIRPRPHFKGHKTLEILEHQAQLGAVGAEFGRLSDIERVVACGWSGECVLAWCHYKPAMWTRVAEMVAAGQSLIVDVDSPAIVDGYSTAAEQLGVVIPIRIQVNTGLRGCSPSDVPALVEHCAKRLGVRLAGVTGYASWYNENGGRNWEPPEVAGRREAELLVSVRDSLVSAGLADRLPVCGGSTPVAEGTRAVRGVDEIGGTTYILSDWNMAQLGLAPTSTLAVEVIVSVTNSWPGGFEVNAGITTFGERYAYPGLRRPLIASTRSGDLVLTQTGLTRAVGEVVRGRSPAVGEQIRMVPGTITELAAVPGEFVVVDLDGAQVATWERLTPEWPPDPSARIL